MRWGRRSRKVLRTKGVEPSLPKEGTGPSILRVCQFRHVRKVVGSNVGSNVLASSPFCQSPRPDSLATGPANFPHDLSRHTPTRGLFWLFWGAKKGGLFWGPHQKSPTTSADGCRRKGNQAVPMALLSPSRLAACGRRTLSDGAKAPGGGRTAEQTQKDFFWVHRKKVPPPMSGGANPG